MPLPTEQTMWPRWRKLWRERPEILIKLAAVALDICPCVEIYAENADWAREIQAFAQEEMVIIFRGSRPIVDRIGDKYGDRVYIATSAGSMTHADLGNIPESWSQRMWLRFDDFSVACTLALAKTKVENRPALQKLLNLCDWATAGMIKGQHIVKLTAIEESEFESTRPENAGP